MFFDALDFYGRLRRSDDFFRHTRGGVENAEPKAKPFKCNHLRTWRVDPEAAEICMTCGKVID